MSQVTQSRISVTTAVRSPRRTVWLATLLALAAGVAIVLVLAFNSGGNARGSAVYGVGSRSAVGPDEARIAASISSPAANASSGPDESRIAAAISGR